MATPQWKVYDAAGKYQAACHEPAAAGVLVAFYGAGATIRVDHRWTVWKEGSEAFSAAESYDRLAEIIDDRRLAINRKAYDRIHGEGASARVLGRRPRAASSSR